MKMNKFDIIFIVLVSFFLYLIVYCIASYHHLKAAEANAEVISICKWANYSEECCKQECFSHLNKNEFSICGTNLNSYTCCRNICRSKGNE